MSNTLKVRTGEVIVADATFGSSKNPREKLLQELCRFMDLLDVDFEKNIKEVERVVGLLLKT